MPTRNSGLMASVLYSRVQRPIDQQHSVYQKFNLKWGEDPVENQGKQGRLYSPEKAREPGGIKLEDAIMGIQMAHLSCTCDDDDRLKGRSPNSLEALRAVVGGDDEAAKKPLSAILKDHFNLTMDCWISESGIVHGHAIDTQGFIASNDTTIVLSYQFSVSMLDWLTNLTFTTSEWKPYADEKRGIPCCANPCQGLFTKYCIGQKKPRVHTGYYNNFVSSLPYIRKYILEPLMDPNRAPTTVYVCGESLGAAIASLAFCFLILELPLENTAQCRHKIVGVTAGSPRVADEKMRQTISDRMALLRPLDSAVFIRLVYNNDLVPHLPFECMGYEHLEKLVFITPEGDIIVNPRLRGTRGFDELQKVFKKDFWMYDTLKKGKVTAASPPRGHGAQSDDELEESKTDFERECEATPGPIKDHMPIWYLTFVKEMHEKLDVIDLKVSQMRRASIWFRFPGDDNPSFSSSSSSNDIGHRDPTLTLSSLNEAAAKTDLADIDAGQDQETGDDSPSANASHVPKEQPQAKDEANLEEDNDGIETVSNNHTITLVSKTAT
jgi:Lipase (class 3)